MVNKNNSFVLHELLLLICLWLSGQGTKSQMQYRSVFTENFQQSEIKMNHWYCMNLHVSDLITFICTLNSPILGDLCRNGYQPELNNNKLHTCRFTQNDLVNLEKKSEIQYK